MPRLGRDQRRAIQMVEEMGTFLRKEWLDKRNFENWPGLPKQCGKIPTLQQANHFFLGCCIDYQERTANAWRRAEHFCEKVVGVRRMNDLWKWIVNHGEKDWKTKKLWKNYKLHRYPAGHYRLYRISRILQERFDGDPRKLWGKGRKGLLPSLVNEVRVGPAIARMIIGALRDHRLIRLRKCDFKPDLHVCRLMKSLGLSTSLRPKSVLHDSARCFNDPWVADIALYHLGADQGIRTKKQVLIYYNRMKRWQRSRYGFMQRIKAFTRRLNKGLGSNDVRFYEDSSLHWVGLDLMRRSGPLVKPMNKDNPCPL